MITYVKEDNEYLIKKGIELITNTQGANVIFIVNSYIEVDEIIRKVEHDEIRFIPRNHMIQSKTNGRVRFMTKGNITNKLAGYLIHMVLIAQDCTLTEYELQYVLSRCRLGDWECPTAYMKQLPAMLYAYDQNNMIETSKMETRAHINKVSDNIAKIQRKLTTRAIQHDRSKLEAPEVTTFAEMTGKLKTSTYGSEEYNGFLKQMKPALDHHYANNRHHPERFKNGIDGMTLVDLIEMIADWKAACERHDDGDIRKSIEYNTKRFNISPQLKQILINTVMEDLN